jgi:delta-1-pyrroline-5-carboxylate synthetase
VKLYSGPKLAEQLTFGPPRAKSLKTEYSGLECTIEVVSGLEEAVSHIHTYGSGHTDVIVTQNGTSSFFSCSVVPSSRVYSSAGNASLKIN